MRFFRRLANEVGMLGKRNKYAGQYVTVTKYHEGTTQTVRQIKTMAAALAGAIVYNVPSGGHKYVKKSLK